MAAMRVHNAYLRVEGGEGSGREYRVVDSHVEVRSLTLHGRETAHRAWHRLTPEQLSIHVERNTVVAKWLQHRMGWRRLLHACMGQLYDWNHERLHEPNPHFLQ